jgi:hypothetical protein
MLLSKKKKFIFIHVPKVAGQSVTNALMPFAASNWQRGLSFIIRYRYQLKIYTKLRKYTGITFLPQPFVDHVRCDEVIQTIGLESFNTYFSFAFVRNPWAWALSQYSYALKNTRHNRHRLVKDFSSFDSYLQWHCNEDENFYLQKSFVCDSDETLLVNFVGKQEQLEKDFNHVCEAIGIASTLPTFNVSTKSSYKERYSQESKDLIAERYAEDIDFFEYQF